MRILCDFLLFCMSNICQAEARSVFGVILLTRAETIPLVPFFNKHQCEFGPMASVTWLRLDSNGISTIMRLQTSQQCVII